MSPRFTMFRVALLLVLLTCSLQAQAGQQVTVAGLSTTEAMAAGERMYREGILPSGEPMTAFVQEDIPVDGTMFTCQNCHLRSGLGTAEGTIITLPTNGSKLYRTLHRGAEVEVKPSREKLAKPFQSVAIRPAYDDKSLARAIWTGITPSEREMDWTMPRYELDPQDMDVLIFYLKNLSKDYSPGLTADKLTFATVITEEVPAEQQQAMLLTLQAYIKDHNSKSRHEGRRAKHGPFYKQDRYTAYRDFELKVWRLTGAPSSWQDQLRQHYDQDPVFALLGGISSLDWTPIERFCEKEQLPCLFPVTDHPGRTEGQWYSMYFSKGFEQESEAAARFLRQKSGKQRPEIIQLISDRPETELLARSFAATWTAPGYGAPKVIRIPEDPAQKSEVLKRLGETSKGKVLVVWAAEDQPLDLNLLVRGETKPALILSSYRLVNNHLQQSSPDLRKLLYLTYPSRLPDDLKGRHQFVRKWLETKNVPVTDMDIHSQMYFLGWMMTGITRMMGNDFYRDYFFDVIDMMNDETYAVAQVPRVSFGPGQRFASKGCFIVQVPEGTNDRITPVSPWVVH